MGSRSVTSGNDYRSIFDEQPVKEKLGVNEGIKINIDLKDKDINSAIEVNVSIKMPNNVEDSVEEIVKKVIDKLELVRPVRQKGQGQSGSSNTNNTISTVISQLKEAIGGIVANSGGTKNQTGDQSTTDVEEKLKRLIECVYKYNKQSSNTTGGCYDILHDELQKLKNVNMKDLSKGLLSVLPENVAEKLIKALKTIASKIDGKSSLSMEQKLSLLAAMLSAIYADLLKGDRKAVAKTEALIGALRGIAFDKNCDDCYLPFCPSRADIATLIWIALAGIVLSSSGGH